VATSAVDFGAYDLKVNGLTIGTGPRSGGTATNNNTNTAIGYNVMTGASSAGGGTANTAVGSLAAQYMKDGAGNSAFGYKALKGNTTQHIWGNENTAIGANALSNVVTTTSRNTAVGYNALLNTTGDNNVALGYNAGNSITTGTFNTIIGADANVSSGSGTITNSTAIGGGASVSASNTIQLGNDFISSVSTKGTVYSNGAALTSDQRLKTNINSISGGLFTVMQLNPVHYFKKNTIESKDYSKEENGFIAQEIKKVLPFIVNEGSDKEKLLSVDYNSLIPVLTKAIQEQQEIIKNLQKENSTNTEVIKKLTQQVGELFELLKK
jgi:hypothetical protein